MKPKPITPYQHIQNDIKEFCSRLQSLQEKIMWRYPAATLKDGYWLDGLHQRVMAADQLGYDVVLLADDDGLTVVYRKKVEIPWKWR